jgi:aldehyde:ferredoxin oxidoreductase
MPGRGQVEKLIRVDMTNLSVTLDPFPEEWALLGGRALSARILLQECDPRCDPLGPDNVLVFAPGLLAGTAAPTSGRLSVGAKSPLTHGIKEANAGGNPAQHLTKLGYRAVIVTGGVEDPERRFGLEVDERGARLVPADDLKYVWNYAACAELAKTYPKAASFITCGPAGERRLAGASVACTDQDNRYPTRHAARGGLGAVMGAKGLKFIAIDPGKSRVRQGARREEFNRLCKEFSKAYLAGPQMMSKGTASAVPVANMLQTFPYKNRTAGQSPDAQTLDGARILESFESRGGGMHNCLTGCIVQCSNVVHDRAGNYTTSALEFETITLLGSNCAVSSWEDVAVLDRLCDEIGLDTIETGAALAVLMDAGGMQWGDVAAMKGALEQIAQGTELGRVVGNGAAAVGHHTGHHRVPVVKGQALPAWDPRPLKATGVTYATSPMGADHTAGLIINPGMPESEFAQASQESQVKNAINDSSGFCQFIGPSVDQIREFMSAFEGVDVSREQIADYGWQCLADEWEFNRRAGFSEADDDLPQCMKEDAIGPAKLVFDVKREVIADARVRKPALKENFFSSPILG